MAQFNDIVLKISKEVQPEESESETHTPANGKTLYIDDFLGEAAFTPNAVVTLLWDYGEAGQVILWSTKGSGRLPAPISVVGDGVKKLAVELENNLTSGTLIMSGAAILREEL